MIPSFLCNVPPSVELLEHRTPAFKPHWRLCIQ